MIALTTEGNIMNKQLMKQQIYNSIRLIRVNLKDDKINQVNIDWLASVLLSELKEVLIQIEEV